MCVWGGGVGYDINVMVMVAQVYHCVFGGSVCVCVWGGVICMT